MDEEVKTDNDVHIGPYRATRLWNDIVQALQAGLPCARHRRYMRTYEGCFAAHEAVEWTLTYLKTNPNFGPTVTRAQTVQLLQKLLKAGVFESVGRQKQPRIAEFGDNGRLYRFCQPGGRSGRSALAIRSVTNLQSASDRPVEQLQECHLKAKILSAEEIADVWKHCLLRRLQMVLGVSSLEEILDASLVSGRSILHNCLYITKTGVVTNVDEKDHLPHWALSAMKCLAKWPEKTDDSFPSYKGFEKDVFRVVADYFSSLQEPLMTWDMYEVITNIFALARFPRQGLKRSRSVRKSLSSPLWSMASLENIFLSLGFSSSPLPETEVHSSGGETRMSRSSNSSKLLRGEPPWPRNDTRLNRSFTEATSSSSRLLDRVSGRRGKTFGSHGCLLRCDECEIRKDPQENFMGKLSHSESCLVASRSNSKILRRGTPKVKRRGSTRKSGNFYLDSHQASNVRTDLERDSSMGRVFEETHHVHVVSPHCEVVEMECPPADFDGTHSGQGFVVCMERRQGAGEDNCYTELGPGDLYPQLSSSQRRRSKIELHRNFFNDELLVDDACHVNFREPMLSVSPKHERRSMGREEPARARHDPVASTALPFDSMNPQLSQSPPRLRKSFSSASHLHLSGVRPVAESSGLQSTDKFGSTPSLPITRYETAFGPDNKTVTRVYYSQGVATDYGHVSAGDREVCTPLETHFDMADDWQGSGSGGRGDASSGSSGSKPFKPRARVSKGKNRLSSQEHNLAGTPVSSGRRAKHGSFPKNPLGGSQGDLSGGQLPREVEHFSPHVPVLDGSSRSQLSRRLSLSSPNLTEAAHDGQAPSSHVKDAQPEDVQLGNLPSLSCQRLEKIGAEKYRDISTTREWFASSASSKKARPKSMASLDGDSLWFSGRKSHEGRSYNACQKAAGSLSEKRKSCQVLGKERFSEFFTPLGSQHRSRSLTAVVSPEQKARNEERMRDALQAACLLIPPANRRKLQLLFRLMARMSANTKMCLDPSQTMHSLLLSTFSRSILCAEDEADMDDLLVRQLVSFLMAHHSEVFSIPAELKSQVEERLKDMQKPQAHTALRISYSPVSPTSLHFCQQVSVTEFENQRSDLSESAIAQLLEHIVNNPHISQKEKKKRLKQFQKTYPDIYAQRFPSSSKKSEAPSSRPRIKQPLLARPLMKLKGLRL